MKLDRISNVLNPAQTVWWATPNLAHNQAAFFVSDPVKQRHNSQYFGKYLSLLNPFNCTETIVLLGRKKHRLQFSTKAPLLFSQIRSNKAGEKAITACCLMESSIASPCPQISPQSHYETFVSILQIISFLATLPNFA